MARVVLVLLVVLAVGGPLRHQFRAEAAEGADGARREIAAGWAHYERQEWERAEASFRKAIASDPRQGDAHIGLAETLLRQGRVAAAGVVAREALPHLKGDRAARVKLAALLSRNRETRRDAIVLYRELLDERPRDDALRLDMARALAWSGHHGDALNQCRRLQKEARSATIKNEARLLEAEVLSWGGRSREAETRYRAILADGPSAEAHYGLGEIARWEGRYGDAEPHYRAAAKLSPGDPRMTSGLEQNHRASAPRVTVRYGWFDDSSDFRRDTYTLFANLLERHRLSLRTGLARIRYEQADGQQIYRTAIPLQGRLWAARGVSLDGGFALNQYGDGADDSTSWYLRGDFSPGADSVRIRAGFHHYDMIDDDNPLRENYYNQAESIAVVPLEIDLDEIRLGALFRLTDRLELNSDVALADISDDNERVIGYSRLSYRLRTEPRVELFGSFYYQNVKDHTPLYFDPGNFQAYAFGARVEGTVGDRFRYEAEGALAFHPREDDLLGGQLFGLAEWDLTERLKFRVTGNHLVSPQQRGGSDDYHATYLSAGLVVSLHRKSPAATGPSGRR